MSFFVLIAGLLVFCFYSLLRMPGQFYRQAISEGIENKFYQIKKHPLHIKKGKSFKLKSIEGLIVSDEKLWKSMHFENMLIPLPVRHPSFLTVPKLKLVGGETIIGMNLLDQKEREFFSFQLLKKEKLITDLDDSLFQLPFFSNRIRRTHKDKIWMDIFTLNLRPLGEESIDGFIKLLKNPDEVIYELMYRLYIYKNRVNILKELKVKGVAGWNRRAFGVVEVVDRETLRNKPQQYLEEIIYLLEGGYIYKVRMRTALENIIAESYRTRFLENIEISQSNNGRAVTIYSDYRRLPYRKKIDQEGMLYLYSAWTHQQEKKEFLAEMIYFLERGESHHLHINSIYEYAYKVYGSSFSSDRKLLKETQQKKLERKIKEEQLKEMRNAKNSKVETPDKFESNQHKIKFFLDRAKGSGVNVDLERKEIMGD